MPFGEYELSPSLIGLSLLRTAHRSFSTLIRAALHPVLPGLQPGHAEITWFRVCPIRLGALFRLAFTAAAGVLALSLAGHGNS